MRWLALPMLLVLAACDPPLGSQDNPVGSPILLAYAPTGTEIVIENTINQTTERVRLTAGTHVGARGAFVGEDGTESTFYPACWGCGGTRIDESAYRALWPLEKGKRASFTRTAANGDTARVEIVVAGEERLTTPAGTFDTWILEGRVEQISGPPYSAQVRAWWAPGPGWVIRARGGDSDGNAFSSEVIDFDFPLGILD